MKKPTKNSEAQNGVVNEMKVSRARMIETKNGPVVFFTLELNGVAINNCRVAEGKNGDFVSLPQYRGSDGKYYSHVFFRFSKEDEAAILAEVEKQINE